MVEKFIQQNTFPSVSCAFADVIASFSASVVIMRLSLRRSLRSPDFSSFSSFPSRSPPTRSFTFHFSWRERMEPARIPRRNLRKRHFARARAFAFFLRIFLFSHTLSSRCMDALHQRDGNYEVISIPSPLTRLVNSTPLFSLRRS